MRKKKAFFDRQQQQDMKRFIQEVEKKRLDAVNHNRQDDGKIKGDITMLRYEQIMQKVFSMPEDWIHTNEGSLLLAEALSIAPLEIKRLMNAKLKELGLMPEPSFVDDSGQAFLTVESVAKTLGVSVEEVNQRCIELKEIHPEDFTPRGGLHRIQ